MKLANVLRRGFSVLKAQRLFNKESDLKPKIYALGTPTSEELEEGISCHVRHTYNKIKNKYSCEGGNTDSPFLSITTIDLLDPENYEKVDALNRNSNDLVRNCEFIAYLEIDARRIYHTEENFAKNEGEKLVAGDLTQNLVKVCRNPYYDRNHKGPYYAPLRRPKDWKDWEKIIK